jgi:transcriptional regulator with XRE-family HTH domain
MTQAPVSPTQAIAERLQELRKRRGWSAAELAERCAEKGLVGLNRSVLANIESGRRKYVTVEELFTLAYVLGVSPTSLLVPPDTVPLAVTPTVTDGSDLVRDWIEGEGPLPSQLGNSDEQWRKADDDYFRGAPETAQRHRRAAMDPLMQTIGGELMTFAREGVLKRQGESIKTDPARLARALRMSARKTSTYVDLLAQELDDRAAAQATIEDGHHHGER